METQADVREVYDVDEHGIIRSPGKFESESWIAPIVYDWYMNGDPGEMFGDTNVYVIDPGTRAAFELADYDYALTLSESDQGFVYVGTIDKAEYDLLDVEENEEEWS